MKNLINVLFGSEEPSRALPSAAVIQADFQAELDRLTKTHTTVIPEEVGNRRRDLDALGFWQSKPVKEAKAMEVEDRVRRAISYFTQKYPQYKFITEESVKRLCEKYGLIYGSVHDYIGDVPDANIKDMQRNSVANQDKCWYAPHLMNMPYSYSYDLERASRIREVSMEIVAPPKDFNLSRAKVVNHRVTPDDPIVLQPVYFEGTKHYLIITAWGPEASDPLVVNEKMN